TGTVLVALAAGAGSCARAPAPANKIAITIQGKRFRVFTVFLAWDFAVSLTALQHVARIERLLVINLHYLHAAGDVVHINHADRSGIPADDSHHFLVTLGENHGHRVLAARIAQHGLLFVE